MQFLIVSRRTRLLALQRYNLETILPCSFVREREKVKDAHREKGNVHQISWLADREKEGEAKMYTPHILLVDDDAALLQALPHMIALRLHGVQVDTADSANEALRQIQLQDYDAIISDIAMPGMDGL